MKREDLGREVNGSVKINIRKITDTRVGKEVRKSFFGNRYSAVDELCYIEPIYYGFDEEYHRGKMIIHKDLAIETLEIFHLLAKMKIPIERMELIGIYVNDLLTSMEYNNTHAFCYRNKIFQDELSVHSFGMAIDINPRFNPYIDLEKKLLLPATAKEFRDRTLEHPAMVDHLIAPIFKHYGWYWGGDDEGDIKRYSHFEKKIKEL